MYGTCNVKFKISISVFSVYAYSIRLRLRYSTQLLYFPKLPASHIIKQDRSCVSRSRRLRNTCKNVIVTIENT
jgi:hypothetical protein